MGRNWVGAGYLALHDADSGEIIPFLEPAGVMYVRENGGQALVGYRRHFRATGSSGQEHMPKPTEDSCYRVRESMGEVLAQMDSDLPAREVD